ncbi:MAG: SOS response-associated peptidase [Solirubrobacteraceae bacterium]
MCGRYTLATGDLAGLRSRFGLDERVEVRQRFNIAPGDEVVAVTPAGGTLLRWGYLRDTAYTTINARAESLAERPTWRTALAEHRCLILADGFFEWKRLADGRTQPYWITRADRTPFAFAGLASTWGTCAIVTTTATPDLAGLHDRMPVILDPESEAGWLEPRTDPRVAVELLRPFADTAHVAVDAAVNNARYDGPACLDPAPPPDPTLF